MGRNQSFDFNRFRGLLYNLLFFPTKKKKKIRAHVSKNSMFISLLQWSSLASLYSHLYIYIYICAYEEKIIANVSWGKRNLFTTVTWSVIQVALSSWLEERCTKAPQIKTVCVLWEFLPWKNLRASKRVRRMSRNPWV